MTRLLPQYPTIRSRTGGFTLIELIVTIVVLGILIGISIPNYTAFKLRAQRAQMMEYVDALLDGEDLYLAENGTFYPESGILSIPAGQEWRSEELGLTLPQGHKHRYLLYSMTRTSYSQQYYYLYLVIYSDLDFNRNGTNDMFQIVTSLLDNRPIDSRRVIQYR